MTHTGTGIPERHHALPRLCASRHRAEHAMMRRASRDMGWPADWNPRGRRGGGAIFASSWRFSSSFCARTLLRCFPPPTPHKGHGSLFFQGSRDLQRDPRPGRLMPLSLSLSLPGTLPSRNAWATRHEPSDPSSLLCERRSLFSTVMQGRPLRFPRMNSSQFRGTWPSRLRRYGGESIDIQFLTLCGSRENFLTSDSLIFL